MTEKNKVIGIEEELYTLSLNKPVIRYSGNPILSIHEVNEVWQSPELQVITVHNAGICRFEDQYLMLFRSHLRNGISVIGKAISDNGLSDWRISPVPFMQPCNPDDVFAEGTDPEELIENEAGGVEDPRITLLGDTYFITYSAYHDRISDRVRVSLATTRDFKTVVRHGPVVDMDMRNVVIFPERIGDNYFALMRPNDHPEGVHIGGRFKEIRLAISKDPLMNEWKILEKPVMKQTGGPSGFSHKIGPGAPPLDTKHGWLSIFHGVRSTMDGNPYVLGVAFHKKDNPAEVLVCNLPVLFPSQADCRVQETDYVHVPNVVFTCGALKDEDGTIRIYYAGNDTVMNVAFSHEDMLYELASCFPQHPLTGVPENPLSR